AWALFTKAHSLNLVAADAQQRHHASDGVGATLSQCQVVFGTTACIGVAFDTNDLLTMAGQVGRMHFNQAAILFRYRVAVEVKVNRALLRKRALRIEGIHNLPRAGRVCPSAPGTGAGLVEWHGATCCQG